MWINATTYLYKCISDQTSSEQSSETTEHVMVKENTQEETVGFLAENKGYQNVIPSIAKTVLRSDSIEGMALASFLSRPVEVLSFTWNESDSINTKHTVEPWYTFFNDARIKNKLHNFAFIQCDLKIKVVINASPFYYGAMMMSYQPLHNFTPSTIATSAANEELVLYSQRPHVWIYPQGNQGADMTLPYFNFRNWTRIWLQQDFKDLGKLTLQNFTPLISANGVTGTGVTVTVFAYADDVKVTGPTVGLALAQAGDEYTGVVSRPSNMIANVAGRLSNVPVIGAFARATSIGAGAVASIASIFGFTNVPNIGPVHAFQPRPFHNFADTSITYPTDKLTLDAKNELAISSDVAGIPNEDPLILSDFIARESFLTSATWSTSNNAGDILFTAAVSPTLAAVDASTTPQIYCPPMAYAAAMFSQWRGDIIFRVHIIASQFHKGRLRLIFDPAGYAGQNVVTDVNSYSGCFNQIVDLGKDTNIEFRIPYAQATQFLNLNQFGVNLISTSTSPSFLYDSAKFNGTFMIRCVTALTAPVASSSVSILISVRSASVELANPKGHIATSGIYSLVPAQAGRVYDDSGEAVVAGKESTPAEEQYLIYYGEQVTSLRQLMKRTSLVTTAYITSGSLHSNIVELVFYRFPPTYGYMTSAQHSAQKIVGTGTHGFWFTPISALTWITPCFVGQRGSINWTVNASKTDGKARPMITASRVAEGSATGFSIGQGTLAYYQMTSHWGEKCNFMAGATIQSGFTNQGLEFQVPMYAMYKFQTTRVTSSVATSTYDGSNYDCFKVMMTGDAADVGPSFFFAGAGTDFNVLFFVNCPTVYQYSARPTPA